MVRQRKSELSPMISEFLFYEENAQKEEKRNYVALKIEIRELIKNDFNRKVLTEILLDLQKDVSGDTQKRLFSIYHDLGLHKDAFEKLKSTRWQVVSKGILELTNMRVAESYIFITKFINDKRTTIRKQAEIATVTLKPEGIAYFLDTTKYRISEWQQLKLLDAMRKLEDFNPPRFKLWLTSKNKHVVLFALRLVKYYNQNDCNASLIELAKHKNNQIREEAIKCIKEFNVVGALDVLKLIFWKSNTVVKISVLDAIAYLGSESDIEFLKMVEKKEFNFSVKSKALSAINVISPESIMPTEGLQDTRAIELPLKVELENDTDKTVDTINSEMPEPADSAETTMELLREEVAVEVEEASSSAAAKAAAVEEEEEEEEVSQMIMNIDVVDAVYLTALLTTEGDEIEPTTVPPVPEKELKTSLDVNFLPFVVDTDVVADRESEISEPSARYKPVNTIAKNDICDIEVVFEAVVNTSHSEATQATVERNEVKNIHDLVVDFLPVVIANQDIVLSNETEINISDSEDFRVIQVIGEDVLPYCESAEEELKITLQDKFQLTDVFDIEVIAPEFVPKPVEEELDKNLEYKKFQQTLNIMKPNDQLKLKAIIEDLVVFENTDEFEEIIEEFDAWPDMEWIEKALDLDFVPLVVEEQTTATSEVVTDSDDSDLLKEDIVSLDDTAAKNVSEKPKELLSKNKDGTAEEASLNDAEEATMKLLDDIEELGDQREIPLLSEFLLNEKHKAVRLRIRNLIAKFANMPFEERPNLISPKISEEVDFEPFNVFEDLFRTCDTAKKLILLDEIVAVGDEKEIPFLDGLLEDPNSDIRKKAQLALQGLMKKLAANLESLGSDKADGDTVPTIEQSDEIDGTVLLEYSILLDEMEIEPPLNADIFDVGFELSENLELVEKTPHEVMENPHDSFLNQLWSFPAKIIEKLNG